MTHLRQVWIRDGGPEDGADGGAHGADGGAHASANGRLSSVMSFAPGLQPVPLL